MIWRMVVVGELQTNCYIVGDEQAGEGMLIDPGGSVAAIMAAVRQSRLIIRYVINTHEHFDHMAANNDVLVALAAYQTPGGVTPSLGAHPQAVPLLRRGGGAEWLGLAVSPGRDPDMLLEDGDRLRVGQLEFQVLHTPGHSPGSISLYCAVEQAVLVGDVLFRRGVGRTDLPGGDQAVLQASIRERLFALPDATRVYPGHGPQTTIGAEKRNAWF